MTREELIKNGYTTKGVMSCQKCGTTVALLESPMGRIVTINPDDHPERPGWLHETSCGMVDPTALCPAEASGQNMPDVFKGGKDGSEGQKSV